MYLYEILLEGDVVNKAGEIRKRKEGAACIF